MHPDICRFISEAVYDGRLVPEPKTERQRLVLDPAAHPEALAATGIRFVCVEHDGCAQQVAGRGRTGEGGSIDALLRPALG